MSRKRAAAVVVESGDEEEEYTQSSQTQDYSQDSGTQIAAEERKALAGNVCSYLLLNESKKIPAKRVDIKKLVLKDRGRYFNEIMTEATTLMSEVYGFKIIQLQKKGCYIVLNDLKADGNLLENSLTSNNEIKGLLTVILTAIFMSGGVMQAGPMRQYLKSFSIDMDSKIPHQVFGNIDRLIHQDLVRQCYLEITYDKAMDPPLREYRWGERAHLELPKKHALELVCKIYGNNMNPEMWASQWKTVQEESNN